MVADMGWNRPTIFIAITVISIVMLVMWTGSLGVPFKILFILFLVAQQAFLWGAGVFVNVWNKGPYEKFGPWTGLLYFVWASLFAPLWVVMDVVMGDNVYGIGWISQSDPIVMFAFIYYILLTPLALMILVLTARATLHEGHIGGLTSAAMTFSVALLISLNILSVMGGFPVLLWLLWVLFGYLSIATPWLASIGAKKTAQRRSFPRGTKHVARALLSAVMVGVIVLVLFVVWWILFEAI